MSSGIVSVLAWAAFAGSWASAAVAQQTWVVDHSGGSGSHFRTISAAVDAASAGDVVLVRSGSYSETALDIDKGLHLVGEGLVSLSVGWLFTPGATVRDLPVDEVFSMTNFELTSVVSTSQWSFTNCAGLIALRSLSAAPTSTGPVFQFADCAQVHGDGLFSPRHSAVVSNRSSIVLTGCAFEGYTGGPLGFVDSRVSLDGCAVVGDASLLLNVPAIHMTGGELKISRSSVRVGAGPSSSPVSAIVASGGEVLLDPTASLHPAGMASPVAGTANVVRGPLTALSVVSTGTRLTTELLGPVGASFVTLLSFQAPVLPTPFGELWLDPEQHFIVHFGQLPAAGRTDSYSVDHVPVPAGYVVLFQSILYDGQFHLSNAESL